MPQTNFFVCEPCSCMHVGPLFTDTCALQSEWVFEQLALPSCHTMVSQRNVLFKITAHQVYLYPIPPHGALDVQHRVLATPMVCDPTPTLHAQIVSSSRFRDLTGLIHRWVKLSDMLLSHLPSCVY
jgi:hypothetical protein